MWQGLGSRGTGWLLWELPESYCEWGSQGQLLHDGASTGQGSHSAWHLTPAKCIRCVWAILLPHWAAQQAEAGQCWVQAWPGTPLHFPWLSHPLDSMAAVDLAGQPLPGLNTARYQKDLHSQGSCFLFHNTSSVISQMEFAQQSSLALTLYPVCDNTPFHCQNTP